MERFAVALRIRHGQRDGEELLSEGEMRAEGELSRTAGGWLLRYEELAEPNHVEMTLLDGEVRMRRFAGGSARVLSEASYRERVEAPMRYEVDGYSLCLAVYPQVVRWRVDPPFADVRLQYLLKAADAQLLHEVRIEAQGFGECKDSQGCDGWALKAQMQAALNGALGARWGFVRRADREDALLVTDAERAAARQGIDPAPIRERLEQAGWHVREAESLWWLDPPEEAFCRALQARRLGGSAKDPAFYAWRDGDLGELQAACAVLLRGGPPQSQWSGKMLPDGPARALIRGAWKYLSGPPARVNRWVREAAQRFAVARREGAFAGEYACGVLLERYLCRMGCGLPPETLEEAFLFKEGESR